MSQTRLFVSDKFESESKQGPSAASIGFISYAFSSLPALLFIPSFLFKKSRDMSCRISMLRIGLIAASWCPLRCSPLFLVSYKLAVRSRGLSGLGLLSLQGGKGCWGPIVPHQVARGVLRSCLSLWVSPVFSLNHLLFF